LADARRSPGCSLPSFSAQQGLVVREEWMRGVDERRV
jgi:hypothetical protein